MVFQCINIHQVPREVLKTAAFGLGFQHLPRDQANVNAWKTMFDPYIKLHSFLWRVGSENCLCGSSEKHFRNWHCKKGATICLWCLIYFQYLSKRSCFTCYLNQKKKFSKVCQNLLSHNVYCVIFWKCSKQQLLENGLSQTNLGK